MILKSYEITKINLNKNNLILFYGKNEALKDQAIKLINKNKQIFIFDEKEILENQNNFLETVTTKSLFEEEKTILIKRASDKILKIIEYIYSKDLKDINIIVNSDELEKKSKLRSFFEKEKECICVPFYPDNEQTLTKLTYNFFKEKNILLSQYSINQIVNKSLGDRKSLINELEKIVQFAKNKKKIEDRDIAKIINLTENYSVSELVNNFLAKNKKKIVNILNENNYSNDDCVLIIRSFLNKSKKILKLSEEYVLKRLDNDCALAFFYHQNIVLCIAKLNNLNLFSSPIVLGGYRPEGPLDSNFVDSNGNSYRSISVAFNKYIGMRSFYQDMLMVSSPYIGEWPYSISIS